MWLCVSCIADLQTISLERGGWQLQHDRDLYDWSTGWLMKARYNCQGDKRTPPAGAWRHLPDRASNRTWEHFIDDRDGHLRIAEGAMKRSADCGPNRTNILILGNSFMRQVFEAIANRFRVAVTAGTLNDVSPPMGMKELQISRRVSLRNFTFLHLPVQGRMNPGCHGYNINAYYKHGPPPSLKRCEDNVAWFELNGSLRIYYIFRPWAIIEGVRGVLKSFNTSLDAIDVLVCNSDCGFLSETKLRDFLNEFKSSCPSNAEGKQYIDFGNVRANLQQQMARDANNKYGAMNGVFERPDFHSCMPGIPDDEVDILFAAIATGNSCTFTGMSREEEAESWKNLGRNGTPE